MSTPAPGWYPDPDPANTGGIRYWDGQKWTEQVATHPAAQVPPAPPTEVPSGEPGYAAAPGYGPQSYGAQGYGAAPAYGYTAAPPVAVAAGRLGPAGQPLAGWWRRAGGLILDGIIIAIPTTIITFIVASAVTSSGETLINEGALEELSDQILAGGQPSTSEITAIFGGGAWPVFWAYTLSFLLFSILNGVWLVARSGQTIGDRAVGVRKVMADRRVPTFGVAFVRWVLPTVVGFFGTIGSIAVLIDYLWPVWDTKSQTLHDKVAKTYVERSQLSGPPVPRG